MLGNGLRCKIISDSSFPFSDRRQLNGDSKSSGDRHQSNAHSSHQASPDQSAYLLLANQDHRTAGLLHSLQRNRHNEPRPRIQRHPFLGRLARRREREIASPSDQYSRRDNGTPREWTLSMATHRNNAGSRRNPRSLHVRMDLSRWIPSRRDHKYQGSSRRRRQASPRVLDTPQIRARSPDFPDKRNPRTRYLLRVGRRLQGKPRTSRRRTLRSHNPRWDP